MTSSVRGRTRWSLVLALLLVATALIGGGPAHAQDVGTEDASGCNVAVCIFLKGSGTTVDSWTTDGYASGYHCNYAHFWRNGSVTRSVYVCGTGTNTTTWNSPGTFSDGDELCNTWSGISGKPCKTIQA